MLNRCQVSGVAVVIPDVELHIRRSSHQGTTLRLERLSQARYIRIVIGSFTAVAQGGLETTGKKSRPPTLYYIFNASPQTQVSIAHQSSGWEWGRASSSLTERP